MDSLYFRNIENLGATFYIIFGGIEVLPFQRYAGYGFALSTRFGFGSKLM